MHNNYKKKENKNKNYKNNQMIYYKIKKNWMVYQNKIKFMNNNYKNCNNKMIIKKILMHNNYKKKGNKNEKL